MVTLGINAYHGDASACLFSDGKLVAAVEEERFNRTKHWAGFPASSIRYCVEEAGLAATDIDIVAINRSPNSNIIRKVLFTVSQRPDLLMLRDRLKNRKHMMNITGDFISYLGNDWSNIDRKVRFVEHHSAHLASSFMVSPFERAALLSVDGFGDFSSVAIGLGEGNKIDIFNRVYFPHSLGLFYTAVTQLLGFQKYGDEYKMMGLAAYGEPEFANKLQKIILQTGESDFKLDLRYFLHHKGGVSMTWNNCKPDMGRVFSPSMEKLLGPVRTQDEQLTDRHMALAASAQQVYEKILFSMLNYLYAKTGTSALCIAGGCAMNSLANGKIFEKTPFENLYIQPAAGDAGGAIGAASWAENVEFGRPREFVMENAFWGPSFSESDIRIILKKELCVQRGIRDGEFNLQLLDEPLLLEKVAKAIDNGLVVGWFQGRSEWGPRALGNRSILVDPRRHDMKEILNLKIKRRESFRPFAPSILREAVSEYFETDADVPFMQQVFKIKPEKRDILPAITHVDGTGRLQTVRKPENSLYYKLIKKFGERTGVPIVLNTSFNENEPIVNCPEEALDCFLRTKMDVLVMGPYFLERMN